MLSLLLFLIFGILLLLSVPIGIAIGLAVIVVIIIFQPLPIEFFTKELITSVDSFPLLAVPFFIFAGDIMGAGGISKRLFNFANSIVGNRTGGFAIATIATCMFFAAISGSGPATVAAMGTIMIPEMTKLGYDRKFATVLVAAAGSIGVIIPPSIPMIMFGVVGSVSIGDLFIAGIVPGILVGIIMMLWAYIYSKKNGYTGDGVPFSWGNVIRTFWDAKWALSIPIIILGGIYGGFFTPTEAAAMAVFVGLIVSIFIYRELDFRNIPKVMLNSLLTTAVVLIIVGTATAFGRFITIEQIPMQIAEAMLSVSDSTLMVMFMITVFLLFVGCFMDTTAAIIILTPILLPVAVQIGYDPIHFGIIMVVNLAIGFITPPLGINLFVASGITGYSIATLSKAIVPFLLAMLLSLLLIILIPQLSLILL